MSTGISNARPRLLITRRLPDTVLARARNYFDTTVWPEDKPIGASLTTLARGCDALLVMVTERIDAECLRELSPNLKALATYSAGYDHIDLPAATAAGIPVFTAPDALHHAVAEIALYLILAAARRTRVAESVLRERTWGPFSPGAMLGAQLTGKRLGIYGMGAIGREIATRARAFGMQIHYHNRSRLGADQECGAQYHDSLDSLLPVSEVFCVAAPSTAETRLSIGYPQLKALPAGAILVNIGRGDLIDERALLELIKTGHLGPVGLDVFQNEPNIDERWLQLPDAVLLPHIGSATVEARIATGLRALGALEQHFAGAPATSCLNPQVYDSLTARADPALPKLES
ncbi:2-hydroxyacid dehydrogenase [Paraburkholderia silviterrae]|uniref:D-glycerate dehydrogenase n=1 Tax=Paraburkholderia silviterrae TaxID=2528715 RepID=A0A4R5M6I9_9BURK|nr:D-glycerate dehydrogenase [Paraburkholderia silviterrae]TDG21744.1 D-glycerate dehydrogenase [Paraburkholderia silviterrae]